MAKYPAIASIGLVILDQLANARPSPEFDNARFELYQSTNFDSPMEEGISLYLYRVEPNAGLRTPPARPSPNGVSHRPALLLDLSFLLTSWAQSAVKQQCLLEWAMRRLEDVPILPAAMLNRLAPEAGSFQADESVEIVLNSISMQDMFYLWDGLRAKAQLSVAYLARAVPID